MRKLTGILLLLLVAIQLKAQNPFEFKGNFFGYFGGGFRAPVKKYFKGDLLDDRLSLKEKSLTVDITHYYFFARNWGAFWNMQIDPSNTKGRRNSDALRFARYEDDYYFLNEWSRNPANLDERMVWGLSYRLERERWRIFTSLGIGFTEFEAVEDWRYLKQKNTNLYYDVELLWNRNLNDPDIQTSFLAAAGVLGGYRLNKRFTAVLNLKLARAKTNFEYRLEKTNQLTGQKTVEDTYSYRRASLDLTASAGIMFTPSIDRRVRSRK